jgi:poly(A) polymerase
VYQFGRQGAVDGLLGRWAGLRAQGSDPTESFGGLLERLREVAVPEFPVKGADLIAAGHSPGRALGDSLKALEADWRDSGFSLSKQDLLMRAGAAT